MFALLDVSFNDLPNLVAWIGLLELVAEFKESHETYITKVRKIVP